MLHQQSIKDAKWAELSAKSMMLDKQLLLLAALIKLHPIDAQCILHSVQEELEGEYYVP